MKKKELMQALEGVGWFDSYPEEAREAALERMLGRTRARALEGALCAVEGKLPRIREEGDFASLLDELADASYGLFAPTAVTEEWEEDKGLVWVELASGERRHSALVAIGEGMGEEDFFHLVNQATGALDPPMQFHGSCDGRRYRYLFAPIAAIDRALAAGLLTPPVHQRRSAAAEGRMPKPPSPVHAAIAAGDHHRLAKLIAEGAKLDAVAPKTGETPLHWAMLHDEPRMLRTLLAAGANPLIAEKRAGCTPYDWTSSERPSWHALEPILRAAESRWDDAQLAAEEERDLGEAVSQPSVDEAWSQVGDWQEEPPDSPTLMLRSIRDRHVSAEPLVPPLRQLWRRRQDGIVLGAAGMIYIREPDATLVALEAETGEEFWRDTFRGCRVACWGMYLVAHRRSGELAVVDAFSGERLRELPAPQMRRLLGVSRGRLVYADEDASGGREVVFLSPETLQVEHRLRGLPRIGGVDDDIMVPLHESEQQPFAVYDVDSGKALWRAPEVTNYGRVLICDGLLAGYKWDSHERMGLVVHDARSGRLLWRQQQSIQHPYALLAPGLLLTVREVTGRGPRNLCALVPTTGETLWEVPGRRALGDHHVTPGLLWTVTPDGDKTKLSVLSLRDGKSILEVPIAARPTHCSLATIACGLLLIRQGDIIVAYGSWD